MAFLSIWFGLISVTHAQLGDFAPLTVGNSWKYKGASLSLGMPPALFKRIITGAGESYPKLFPYVAIIDSILKVPQK